MRPGSQEGAVVVQSRYEGFVMNTALREYDGQDESHQLLHRDGDFELELGLSQRGLKALGQLASSSQTPHHRISQ
jgi:hypothetical protein